MVDFSDAATWEGSYDRFESGLASFRATIDARELALRLRPFDLASLADDYDWLYGHILGGPET